MKPVTIRMMPVTIIMMPVTIRMMPVTIRNPPFPEANVRQDNPRRTAAQNNVM
jgi:hypothetical protein